jgi:hypothetical protein
VSVIEDISTMIQQVGKSKYISKFDAKLGYHQCPVNRKIDGLQLLYLRMKFTSGVALHLG